MSDAAWLRGYGLKLKRSIRRKLRWYRQNRDQVRDLAVILKLPAALLALFLMVVLFPYNLGRLVPEPFAIKNHTTGTEVLSVIVNALSSILGIAVAIMLVVFELLRKSYGSYAFQNFFRSPDLKQVFQLYVGTILIAFISLLGLEANLTKENLNLIYLSGLLFLICLLALYPGIKQIILFGGSRETIRTLINRIDGTSIRELLDEGVSAETIEQNPIHVLGAVAARAIRNNDEVTCNLIIVEASKQVIKLLEQSRDNENYGSQRDPIAAFVTIVDQAVGEAIPLRYTSVLATSLDAVKNIHLKCAEIGTAWHQVKVLDEALKMLVSASIKSGFRDLAAKGYYLIVFICQRHLEQNTPSASEISDLHWGRPTEGQVKHDTDKSLQWRHVSDDYVSMMRALAQEAIKERDEATASQAIRALSNLLLTTLRADIDDLKKIDVVRMGFYYLRELTVEFARKELHKESILWYPFDSEFLRTVQEAGASIAESGLTDAGETMIKLAKMGALGYFDVRMSGIFLLQVMRTLETVDHADEALKYWIKVLGRVGEESQGGETEERKRVYVEAFVRLDTLKQGLQKLAIRNLEIEGLVDATLSKFDRIEEHRHDLTNTVTWPDPGDPETDPMP